MASFNRVILMGNLTRDVDLRCTPSQTPVTDVTIAVNDRRKNSSGDWVDETTFVEVTLWGRTAEVAAQYLSKGSPLLIEGRLKLDTWETDGQKRSKLRVVGERMQMLGSRSGGSRTGGAQTSGGAPATAGTHEVSGSHEASYQQPHSQPTQYQQTQPAESPAAQQPPPQDDIPF